MQTSETIIGLLTSFHQASICKGLAFSHQQEELEVEWSNILEVRTRQLLSVLLDREPTEDEVCGVLAPPYPEEPYEP